MVGIPASPAFSVSGYPGVRACPQRSVWGLGVVQNSRHENRPKSLFVNCAPYRMRFRAVFKHSASRPAELFQAPPVYKRRTKRLPQPFALSTSDAMPRAFLCTAPDCHPTVHRLALRHGVGMPLVACRRPPDQRPARRHCPPRRRGAPKAKAQAPPPQSHFRFMIWDCRLPPSPGRSLERTQHCPYRDRPLHSDE